LFNKLKREFKGKPEEGTGENRQAGGLKGVDHHRRPALHHRRGAREQELPPHQVTELFRDQRAEPEVHRQHPGRRRGRSPPGDRLGQRRL